MPQGGIDLRENPAVAARREMQEEIGTDAADLLQESAIWRSYDLPPEIAGRMWKGRYRGQTQKWFAFLFTGDEGEIDIRNPAGGRHRPEFDEWRWEAMERLPELIIPFKRPVYEKVVAAFRDVRPDSRG
jgi:putative (di)nucleoside polyphosphate hydrolase